MLGIGGDLFCEQAQCSFAIAEQRPRECLERQELPLRIELGAGLRSREHTPGAIGEPGAREHGCDADFRTDSLQTPLSRRRQLAHRVDQLPGLRRIRLYGPRGHQPQLAVQELGLFRKAPPALGAPVDRVGRLLQVVRRRVEAPEDLVGHAEVGVRFVGALRVDLRLHVVGFLIVEMAQGAPGARLGRGQRDRRSQVCLGLLQRLGRCRRRGYQVQQVAPIA